ncbi:MAG: formate dehydrogenase subunit gamma [bacterium]
MGIKMINDTLEKGRIQQFLELWENFSISDEIFIPEMNEQEGWVARLNQSEVWQHNLVWVTFLCLVLTGMMAFIPAPWIKVMFGRYAEMVYRWRRILHFVFAIGLFIGSITHVWYMFLTKQGRGVLNDILLRPHDFAQMVENVQYYLGMRYEPPLFDRYDYKEKLEYLFGCIGTCVIFITGFIMTFEALFPKFAVEVAATFHLMEATLASCAITIWHFYAVHWKPGKFPQDTSWIDGKMSLHHLEEEHPIYYDRIMKERRRQLGYRAKKEITHDTTSTYTQSIEETPPPRKRGKKTSQSKHLDEIDDSDDMNEEGRMDDDSDDTMNIPKKGGR